MQACILEIPDIIDIGTVSSRVHQKGDMKLNKSIRCFLYGVSKSGTAYNSPDGITPTTYQVQDRFG